jgi:Fuc2NAc and GlcNAc transferase
MQLDSALLLTLLLAFVASWLVSAGVVSQGWRIGLVQAPNHRSSHSRPTPQGGGIGIVLSVLGGAWPLGDGHYSLLFAAALVIAIVGLWDDIFHVPVAMRLLVQASACLTAIIEIPVLPDGQLFLLILLIAGVWWINLFNFMDGIDGLAGSQAVFMLLAAAALAVMSQQGLTVDPHWQLLPITAAATLGFLIWNLPRARLFMGDVGSTFLAFVLFVACLLSVRAGWLSFPIWLILAAVFVTDATVTLLIRIARGKRWIEAHRSHIYQHLAVMWKGHGRVDVIFMTMNGIFLFPLAVLALMLPERAWLIALVAYCPLLTLAFVLQMKVFPND